MFRKYDEMYSILYIHINATEHVVEENTKLYYMIKHVYFNGLV